MRHALEARIEKLEASAGTRRKVVIWEDGTGSAEREIASLAAGEGDVEFIIVRWLSDD